MVLVKLFFIYKKPVVPQRYANKINWLSETS